MSDMVARVRNAIDAVQLWTRHNDHDYRPPMWEVCRYGSSDEAEIVVLSRSSIESNVHAVISEARARAAIEAMREPTEAMTYATRDIVVGFEGEYGDYNNYCDDHVAGEIYRAMIDEALK